LIAFAANSVETTYMNPYESPQIIDEPVEQEPKPIPQLSWMAVDD
jgi:hypothetical protein